MRDRTNTRSVYIMRGRGDVDLFKHFRNLLALAAGQLHRVAPLFRFKIISSYRVLFYSLLCINIIALSFIFTPLTNYLYSYIEVEEKIEPTDGIILLSSGHYTDNILARDTYQRIFKAFRLYKKGFADKIFVCGGSVFRSRTPVAEVMKGILIEMGVKPADITVETQSTNTYENILNVRKLLEKHTVKKPLLVTSSYHMFRSLAISNKLGLEVYPAPVRCYEKEITSIMHKNRHVLIILREYGAIVYFWIRQWI